MSLPLPPPSPYALYEEPIGYYRFLWDTTGSSLLSEAEGWTIITPQVWLMIYGREVDSPFKEDADSLKRARGRGRIMGEWFSTACPEGELGMQELSECIPIGVEEFSAAYQRQWKEEDDEREPKR